MNIDSNTLFVDAANNRVGIGTGSPATALEVNGNITLPISFAIGKTATVQNGTDGSIAIGNLAVAGGNGNNEGAIAIGKSASAASGDYPGAVAIGANALAGHKSVAIGKSASSGTNGSAIGYQTNATGGGLAIGYVASAVGSYSIALGFLASAASANHFVAGGDGVGVINEVFFGKGITSATPTAYTINGTGGSGVDINGGNLILAGGKGTGTGTGGAIVFRTSSAGGTSNSTLNALSNRMTIDSNGNVGIGTSSPGASSILDISSTTKGVVLPRMTKAQRDAIASPVAGMAIYQTDNTPGLRVYNGTNWMRFTETAD
jgi:hypothetical protein